MLGLVRLLPPCFCPPSLSGGGVRESVRLARKAVHNSPPSSEANPRWQSRSHITRRLQLREEIRALGGDAAFGLAYEQVESLRP
jgi:hypothetical protein